jgi:hypothetical protein
MDALPRLRDECVIVNQFTTIEDARARIEAGLHDYNVARPRSSLGQPTPNEPVRGRQVDLLAEGVARFSGNCPYDGLTSAQARLSVRLHGTNAAVPGVYTFPPPAPLELARARG